MASKNENKEEKKETPLQVGMRTYHHATANCTSCCLYCKDSKTWLIPSQVWFNTQTRILDTRKNYSEREKDAVLKQSLYNKIKESEFKSEKEHIQLKFSINFHIDDGSSENHEICELCYVSCYSFCFDKDIFNLIEKRTWDSWKHQMKKNILVAGFAAEATAAFCKQRVAKGGMAKYENVEEAKKALEPLGFNEHEYFQWACVPDNPASREAYLWLYNFFALVGDNAPNRYDKIQIPRIYTQESIHRIYAHHVTTIYTGNEHDPLEIRAFETLWNNVFPNVSIAKYCHVNGKCFSCHANLERQEVFTCESDLKDIQKLAGIHKILIEMNRGAYMDKRQLAEEFKELYMSLIIDGMSQDHCILPYYAGEAKETGTEIKQKIIGAKQHGFSRTFYRVFPHVKGGANVACEVLLHEIERRQKYCIESGKKFPRVLFLQIDGGPENTSKTFYALCEQLVREGVFDRIEAARLPVGHTHEDIDAMFGVLWRAAQGKTVITPQQWEEMAIAAFNQ